LLADFLPVARDIPTTRSNVHHGGSFKRVFTWIDSLRAGAYYMSINVDNLEDVFSTLELARQCDPTGMAQLYSDLKLIVLEVLDLCPVTVAGDRVQPDQLYVNFVERFLKLNENRLKVGQISQANPDVIITLNYDVNLEYVLNWRMQPVDYGLEGDSDPKATQLLKLHGSVGWGLCRACSKKIQVIPPKRPDAPVEWLKGSGPIRIRMLDNLLPTARCVTCGVGGLLEPVVIPPTWAKSLPHPEIGSVWRRATAAIEAAGQIMLVGYSMPESDAFIRYLLLLGLAKNKLLRRVIVVNPDGSAEFRHRYERMFARDLAERGKVVFRQETFEMFVQGSMAGFGSGAM